MIRNMRNYCLTRGLFLWLCFANTVGAFSGSAAAASLVEQIVPAQVSVSAQESQVGQVVNRQVPALRAASVAVAPITVETTWQLSGTADLSSLERVLLVGLAGKPDSSETVLALELEHDTAAWWPTWQLRLQSDVHLLDPLSTDASTEVNLAPGHIYRAALSYEPAKGLVVVSLTDTATGKQLYGNSFATRPYAQPLTPAAGILAQKANAYTAAAASVTSADSAAALTGWQEWSWFAPVNLSWQPVVTDEAGNYIPTDLIERQSPASLRLRLPGSILPQGSFRFILSHAGQEQELAVLATPGAHEALLPLPTTELPLGTSNITCQYIEAGQIRLSEAQSITVGRAELIFDPVESDFAAQALTSTLHVKSADAIQLHADVRATITELQWNPTLRSYREVEYRKGIQVLNTTIDVPKDGQSSIPVKLALPDRPGMWNIYFDATVDPAVKSSIATTQRRFVTYRPAVASPGKPYTIAVLPDVQYMTKNYPEILTKQLQWLSEHAADRNIGLVLQVGDLTNDNTPVQWDTAYDALHLLHGITPTVIAMGNHDLAPGHGAVVQRGDSLVNQYFKPADFPGLAGMFQEGRLENTYHTFTIGDQDYLVLSLEFCPPDEVLTWADEVVERYPTHKVILLTHAYTAKNGYRIPSGQSANAYEMGKNRATTMNDGDDIWRKFVRKHANMFMVISGHIGVSTIPRHISIGDNGNRVYEILVDYQNEPNGGDGWLALLDFDPSGIITVRAYSPYWDKYNSFLDGYGYDNYFQIDTVKGMFVKP